MARKPRIEIEDALYHVITRGNQKQKIFKSQSDFETYLSVLTAYKKRYQYSLYAYVLMNNHVHLLIEVKKTPLSKIMQGINQSYTMYFNREHGTVGHLFQGRYKAILCDREDYLLSLVKYIHLNPVRAGKAVNPDEYPWSGHRAYIQKSADKRELVDRDQVLVMFSENKSAAVRLYKAYMGDGAPVKKEDIYSTVGEWILGGERFIEKVRKEKPLTLQATKRAREYTLTEIAKAIELTCGATHREMLLQSKERGVSQCRKVMSLVAHEYGYRGTEIAAFLGKDPVMVTRHLRERAGLKKEVEQVIDVLEKGRI